MGIRRRSISDLTVELFFHLSELFNEGLKLLLLSLTGPARHRHPRQGHLADADTPEIDRVLVRRRRTTET